MSQDSQQLLRNQPAAGPNDQWTARPCCRPGFRLGTPTNGKPVSWPMPPHHHLSRNWQVGWEVGGLWHGCTVLVKSMVIGGFHTQHATPPLHVPPPPAHAHHQAAHGAWWWSGWGGLNGHGHLPLKAMHVACMLGGVMHGWEGSRHGTPTVQLMHQPPHRAAKKYLQGGGWGWWVGWGAHHGMVMLACGACNVWVHA